MSTLRNVGARFLRVGLLDWLAAGAGSGGTRILSDRTAAMPQLPAADDNSDDRYRTEREREIELRVLMSNWM